MRPSPSIRAANQAIETAAAIIRAHEEPVIVFGVTVFSGTGFYVKTNGTDEWPDFLGRDPELVAVARCIVEHEAHTRRGQPLNIPTPPAPVRGTTQSGTGDEVRR